MFKYVLTLILLLLPACVHAVPTASDCDFNNSGKVDFADFIAFSQGYGTTQTQFDLNGDGAVTFRDLSFLPNSTGRQSPQQPLHQPPTLPLAFKLGCKPPILR